MFLICARSYRSSELRERAVLTEYSTFYDRVRNDYARQKNFYALAYDQNEVIDAVRTLSGTHIKGVSDTKQGMRGNDARYINHGCAPNLNVYKCQLLGDGLEEYEVGMWARRDIKQGEEVSHTVPDVLFPLSHSSWCTTIISKVLLLQARTFVPFVNVVHGIALVFLAAP